MDNEVDGTGNRYDYDMRIYNPRVARFVSVDPITKKYPELTPYQFASNRPIDGIDLDGLEFLSSNECLIYFINGVIAYDVHNVSGGTRKQIKARDNAIITNDKNIKIALDISGSKSKQLLKYANNNVFPNSTGKIYNEAPLTKKSNYTQYNKNYKRVEFDTYSPKAARKLSIIDATIWLLQLYDYGSKIYDNKIFED